MIQVYYGFKMKKTDGQLWGSIGSIIEENHTMMKEEREHLLKRIDSYVQERRRKEYQEKQEKENETLNGATYEALLTGTWEPVEVLSDPTFTVEIKDLAGFGDFFDAKKTEISKVTAGPGSTISFTVDTVRSFLPGVYTVTTIKLMKNSDPI